MRPQCGSAHTRNHQASEQKGARQVDVEAFRPVRESAGDVARGHVVIGHADHSRVVHEDRRFKRRGGELVAELCHGVLGVEAGDERHHIDAVAPQLRGPLMDALSGRRDREAAPRLPKARAAAIPMPVALPAPLTSARRPRRSRAEGSGLPAERGHTVTLASRTAISRRSGMPERAEGSASGSARRHNEAAGRRREPARVREPGPGPVHGAGAGAAGAGAGAAVGDGAGGAVVTAGSRDGNRGSGRSRRQPDGRAACGRGGRRIFGILPQDAGRDDRSSQTRDADGCSDRRRNAMALGPCATDLPLSCRSGCRGCHFSITRTADESLCRACNDAAIPMGL